MKRNELFWLKESKLESQVFVFKINLLISDNFIINIRIYQKE